MSWLDGALTTIALCWRLDRRDGVTLGFTAHDRDLVVGGLSYAARPGMLPSAIRQAEGFDVDTLDLDGAFSDAGITEADMTAGRWDGAALALFAVDWSDPAAEPLALAHGELGDVTLKDGAFTVELRGPTALLERPVVETISPDCRAELGDRRCRVALAPRTRLARVTAAAATVLTLDTAEPFADAYAAGGDSVRGAIEGLAQALPVAFAVDPAGLRLIDETAPPVAIARADLGARADETRTPRMAIERRAPGTLSEAVTIDYYDPARDFQTGTQGARRGAAGRRVAGLALPAALSAADARALAESALAREWAGREQASLVLPPRWLRVAVGSIVTLPGRDGRWRVTRRGFEGGAVTIAAVRLPGGGGIAPAADAGRATAQPDRVQGPTRLALLDLPPLGDPPSDTATLSIAAAGDDAGWRRATLIGSLDGGVSWSAIGDTAVPAAIGTATTALPPGDAMLVDERSVLEIVIPDLEAVLAGDDRLGWSAASNLMLVGDELIQFGVAEAIAPGRWRLRRLLRGRRGTEWAMAAHGAGERVVAIDAEALALWTLPAAALGATIRVAATGRGDLVPALAEIEFTGRSLAPPAPAALWVRAAGDGLVIGWTRRSRAGWVWRDGGDAPLGEEAERYRVTLAGSARTIATDGVAPTLAVDAATRLALGGGPIAVSVAQIGTVASSVAATTTFPNGD